MKKSTLLAGLLLLLGTPALRAQTRDITSYLPDDGEDYRGYCIERAKFDKGEGYLVAGSRAESGKNTSVHLLSIIAGNASTTHDQVLYLPKFVDVRAIGLAMIRPDRAALLLQTKGESGPTRATVVLLDCSDFNHLVVQGAVELRHAQEKFPTSICASPDEKMLYVAGYSLDDTNPTFSSPKRAFVTALDASSLAVVATNLYDSPNAPNGTKDYDMIQRVRFIDGNLYAIGSVNGVYPQYLSSTSRAWVALLDPGDLHILKQSMSGNEAWAQGGVQGVDLVADVQAPGYYYLVGDEYQWHSWFVSRLQPSLEITSGGSAFNNTLWYAYSSDIKGHGILAQAGGRLNVYGGMRYGANVPAGLNVASFGDGAVPFVTSFDPVNNATTGLDFSNLTWYNEGNLNTPSTATYLHGRQTPYWRLTGDLSYWAVPAFGLLADPSRTKSDLALMGHVGYQGSYPNPDLAPRLIESDPDGKVDGCDASADITDQTVKGVLPQVLLNDKIDVTEHKEEVSERDVATDFPERGHKTQTCSADGYYRKAPAAAQAASGTGAPALLALVPNPATDAVTLRWSGAVAAGAALRLELTDLLGRAIGHGTLQARDAASGSFALPALAPGLYGASLYVDGVLAGQQKLSIR